MPAPLTRAAAVFALALSTLIAPASARAADPSAAWHLDPSFGSGGIVLRDPGKDRQLDGTDVVVQDDGRIVVGGEQQTYGARKDHSDVFVARFLADGQPDQSFGDNGIVLITFARAIHFGGMALTEVSGQVKISVAGHVYRDGSNPTHSLFILRLNADGSYDTSSDADPDEHIGVHGWRFIQFPTTNGAWGTGLAVQPDGSLVASSRLTLALDRASFGAVRVDPSSGDRDVTFSKDGRAQLGAEACCKSPDFAIAVQPVGDSFRIVLGGYRYDYDLVVSDWLMIGVTPEGTRDRTFGTDGYVRTRVHADVCEGGGGTIKQIEALPDGALVVGGDACTYVAGLDMNQDMPAIARYLPNGSLDPSFDDDGLAYPLPDGRDDVPGGLPLTGIAVAPDGSVAWCAYADTLGPDSKAKMIVGAVRQNGSLDKSFGAKGSMEISVGPDADIAYGITYDREGRLLVTGSAAKWWFDVDGWMALLRLTR